MPAAIDDRIYSLVVLRHRWRDNEGRSTLDRDVVLESPGRILAYLPRLTALGFLAPFPGQWSEQGSFLSTSIMRRAVGFEMMLVYAAWVGLASAFWRWRGRLEWWFVVAYGGVTTLVLTVAIPNIGSLHRARYGFLMALVAVGTACIVSLVSGGRLNRVAADKY
jgi:hypothetical protein